MEQLNKNGRQVQNETERICAEKDGKSFKVLFSKAKGFFNPIDPMYSLGDEWKKHEQTQDYEFQLKTVTKRVYDTYVDFLKTKRASYQALLRNMAYEQ